MQLKVRNKLFNPRGSSTVKTMDDKPYLKVEGRFFSFRKRKYIKDLEGKTIYQVRNRFWNFFLHSAYIFDDKGEKICQVTRKLSLKSKFEIVGTSSDYKIDGDVIGWNYSIVKDGKVIATIRRKFDITDSFILDSKDEETSFAIALIIAIDNIMDNERDSSISID